PSPRVEVHAARVKAGLFAANWAGPATVTNAPTFTDPTIVTAWGNTFKDIGNTPSNEVPPDAVYDRIQPGSWVAIERPRPNEKTTPIGRTTSFHVVTGLRIASMSTHAGGGAGSTASTGTGFAAKVTLLTLDPVWLSDLPTTDSSSGVIKYGDAVNESVLLRET